MSRILADVNVPEEYVSALRGDGHDVVYSREISALGPEATDDAIVEYAASDGIAIITTDLKDVADREAAVPVFVAPQDMTGGAIRAAVARIEALPFDPAETDPISVVVNTISLFTDNLGMMLPSSIVCSRQIKSL